MRDKTIIDLIKDGNNRVVTEDSIIGEINKAGLTITYNELTNFLVEAEKAGLVTKELRSLNDKPYISWTKNIKIKIFTLRTPLNTIIRRARVE